MSSDRPSFASAGVASRYAKALYALADERRAVESVLAEVKTLLALIADNPALQALIASPVVDAKRSRDAVLAVMGSNFGGIVRNLVGVIGSNRRLKALPAILAAFDVLVAQRRGVTVAEVVTAKPLSAVQRAQLRARLTELGYGNVALQESIDSALLGGLILKIGARLYDTSLKSRLQRLQHAMKEAA